MTMSPGRRWRKRSRPVGTAPAERADPRLWSHEAQPADTQYHSPVQKINFLGHVMGSVGNTLDGPFLLKL